MENHRASGASFCLRHDPARGNTSRIRLCRSGPDSRSPRNDELVRNAPRGRPYGTNGPSPLQKKKLFLYEQAPSPVVLENRLCYVYQRRYNRFNGVSCLNISLELEQIRAQVITGARRRTSDAIFSERPIYQRSALGSDLKGHTSRTAHRSWFLSSRSRMKAPQPRRRLAYGTSA